VVRATDGGLRPPAPSSVAPSGIPTRLTDDTEPDEADAVGPVREPLPIEAQVPDAVPVMPPPSNTDAEADIPAGDIPVIEPSPMPKDVCGIEPPTPEHVMLPVVGPIGDAPGVIGLTPGDASSVAPKGTRMGATGEPEPMPSGEVMPSDEEPGEKAHSANLCKGRATTQENRCRGRHHEARHCRFDLILHWTSSCAADKDLIAPRGHYFARIAAICAILPRSERLKNSTTVRHRKPPYHGHKICVPRPDLSRNGLEPIARIRNSSRFAYRQMGDG
jgi:hypothetical protein